MVDANNNNLFVGKVLAINCVRNGEGFGRAAGGKEESQRHVGILDKQIGCNKNMHTWQYQAHRFPETDSYGVNRISVQRTERSLIAFPCSAIMRIMDCQVIFICQPMRHEKLLEEPNCV